MTEIAPNQGLFGRNLERGTYIVKTPNVLGVLHLDQTSTVAVIEVDGLVGTGLARCNPIDHYNSSIGISIALARALKNLAEGLEQTWVERAKTKEEVKAQRASKRKGGISNGSGHEALSEMR